MITDEIIREYGRMIWRPQGRLREATKRVAVPDAFLSEDEKEAMCDEFGPPTPSSYMGEGRQWIIYYPSVAAALAAVGED